MCYMISRLDGAVKSYRLDAKQWVWDEYTVYADQNVVLTLGVLDRTEHYSLNFPIGRLGEAMYLTIERDPESTLYGILKVYYSDIIYDEVSEELEKFYLY
ncbi:MAG: hypothetical protein LUD68_07055 [Rikenellaceae bacterium]|nr:hypothetical protein [Rikenellaceae bacterium]